MRQQQRVQIQWGVRQWFELIEVTQLVVRQWFELIEVTQLVVRQWFEQVEVEQDLPHSEPESSNQGSNVWHTATTCQMRGILIKVQITLPFRMAG